MARRVRSASGVLTVAMLALRGALSWLPVPVARATPDAGSGCTSCHTGMSGSGHPSDVEYARAVSGLEGAYRPEAEVIRRGVFLPEGKVQCTTCHDAKSPWKCYIALPPGSTPRPAVDPRDPRTYDPDLIARTTADLRAAAALGERPAVSPKPLCLACHVKD